MKKFVLLLSLVFCLYSFSCSKKESAESIPSVVADGPLQYVLEDLSGTVMVQRFGESQAEPAQEEETVQEGDEVITQAGSEASLTLNETTLFCLSESSDVKLDKLFRNGTPQSFTSRLSLVAGKILSEVEKLSESKSSFEIEAGGVVCGVRGTSFEVAKQDSDIQTTTYNGAVETQKDGNSQTVAAGEHGDFSASQGTFLPKRDITPEEKAGYQNWTSKLAAVRQKTHQRWSTLRSLDRLPAGQKQAMLQQVSTVNGKDRLKSIHQIIQANQNQSRSNQKPLVAQPHFVQPKPVVRTAPQKGVVRPSVQRRKP
jgi:hypothetical protein